MSVRLELSLRSVPYHHPDAVALTEQAQQLYVGLYGSPDDSPTVAAEFVPPGGGFVVGYEGRRPVAMGGWHVLAPGPPVPGARPAEIKRMFVAADRRRRGLARTVLARLETEAARAGADWMVLETGTPQVEAIELYRRCGYTRIPKFGHYAGSPLSMNLGKQLRATPSPR